MTEYIASSAMVGRRPRISRMLAYSSALRPSSAHGCSTSGVDAACSTVSSCGRACDVGHAVAALSRVCLMIEVKKPSPSGLGP